MRRRTKMGTVARSSTTTKLHVALNNSTDRFAGILVFSILFSALRGCARARVWSDYHILKGVGLFCQHE